MNRRNLCKRAWARWARWASRRGKYPCDRAREGLILYMNSAIEMPPQAVRKLVHQKLDAASDAEVAEVHKILLELEARRLWAELGAEFAEDWKKGSLTTENVAAAVQAHRAKQ